MDYFEKIEVFEQYIETEEGKEKKRGLEKEKELAKLCEKNIKVYKANLIVQELLPPLIKVLKKKDKNTKLTIHVNLRTPRSIVLRNSFIPFNIVWWEFNYMDTTFKIGVRKKHKLFDIDKMTYKGPANYHGNSGVSKLSLEGLRKYLETEFLDYIIQGKA